MKKKFIVAFLAVVLVVGVCGGVLYMLKNPVPVKEQSVTEEKQKEEVVVENTNIEVDKSILSYNSQGKVFLYGAETSDVIDVRNLQTIIGAIEGPVFFKLMDTNGSRAVFLENVSQTLISVEPVKGSLDVKVIEVPDKNEVAKITKVIMDDNYIYIFKDTQITKFSIYGGNEVVTTTLKTSPEEVSVINERIFFTFKDQLAVQDTKTNETSQILVGDKITSMASDGEFIYLLNGFGNGIGNTTLMKISTSTMLVDKAVVINTVGAKILGVYEGALYIAKDDEFQSLDTEDLKTIKTISLKGAIQGIFNEGAVFVVSNGVLSKTSLESQKSYKYEIEAGEVLVLKEAKIEAGESEVPQENGVLQDSAVQSK